MAGDEMAGQVVFTTKELILQLTNKVDTLLAMVSDKASAVELASAKADIVALKAQMDHRNASAHKLANDVTVLHGKVLKLETEAHAENAVASFKKWFFGIVVFNTITAAAAIYGLVVDKG